MNLIKKYPFLAVLGLLITVLIVIFIAVIFVKKGTAELEILVVPTDAKVVIEGEIYENGTYTEMEAGVYGVNISRKGFKDVNTKIELKNDEKTKLFVALDSEDGQYEYSDQEKSLIGIIDEYKTEEKAKEYIEKYKIMKVLPIVVEQYNEDMTEYTSFRVDGGKFDGCESDFCVKITDITGGNYVKAKEVVKKKGYTLDDYEVIYEDVSAKGKAF